jgi:hypothetical protein
MRMKRHIPVNFRVPLLALTCAALLLQGSGCTSLTRHFGFRKAQAEKYMVTIALTTSSAPASDYVMLIDGKDLVSFRSTLLLAVFGGHHTFAVRTASGQLVDLTGPQGVDVKENLTFTVPNA